MQENNCNYFPNHSSQQEAIFSEFAVTWNKFIEKIILHTYILACLLAFYFKRKKTNDNMQKKPAKLLKNRYWYHKKDSKPSFIQWTRIRTSNQESVKGKFEGTMSWKCWVGPVNVSFVELERVDRNLSNSSLGGFEVFAN